MYARQMNNDPLWSTTSVGTGAGCGITYLRMIVVGQTPPPFGGQTIMIRRMLDLEIPGVEMHHVPMRFSRQMSEVGRFSPWKLIELLRIIMSIIETRIRTGAKILYYPPAGPHLVPVLRDIVILITTRWMFR